MKSRTTEQFIYEAKVIHGDKYSYSKVDYKNSSTKIIIICVSHGEFMQRPSNHLFGYGCSKCATQIKAKERAKSQENFLKEANIIHDNKYDYSNVIYENDRKKIIIKCHTHGFFEQRPGDHLRGKGCAKCSNNIKKTTNLFIKDAINIHGKKYNYSKVKYINSSEKIIINCTEHGNFWQRPYHHLSGGGCPKCKESKGEKKISHFLKKNGLEFISQFKFDNCKSIDFLKFDFYLPEYKLCIEYDGEQHFKPIEHFGGESKFLELRKRDDIKTKFCKDEGISLIRISYLDFKNIEEILLSYFSK
jgi:very-short-patch-repair endonuclease